MALTVRPIAWMFRQFLQGMNCSICRRRSEKHFKRLSDGSWTGFPDTLVCRQTPSTRINRSLVTASIRSKPCE